MLCGMTDCDRRLLGARLVKTFAAEGVEIWDWLGDILHMVKGNSKESEHIKNDVRVQILSVNAGRVYGTESTGDIHTEGPLPRSLVTWDPPRWPRNS